MRWNIIVECVGKDGKQSKITLGTIERLAGSTIAENLGVNPSIGRTFKCKIVIPGRADPNPNWKSIFRCKVQQILD
jgi:hypothetical protein